MTLPSAPVDRDAPQSAAAPAQRWAPPPGVPSLGDLLMMPPEELHRYDLAYVNLLCATGLPDTPTLNVDAALAKVQQWAQLVKRETQRNLYRFKKTPGRYHHSEAYFRAGMMITVLQQDLRVHYNPDCINTSRFEDSSEGFIHGLLNGRGGTCANLPVLYAAIGRKLGYPIYLCCAKAHTFCRWATSDGRERFNIEGSGRGFSSFPDDYYMEWPNKIDPRQVYLGFYLRNLDPNEEMAHFMTIRGHCLQDRGLLLDALVAYAHAHRLGPFQPHHFAWMMNVICEELKIHGEGKAPSSYREWESWKNIPRPRRVLKDEFPRISKSRPPFLPKRPLEFPNGEREHGI